MRSGQRACYLYCLTPPGRGIEAAAAGTTAGVDRSRPVLTHNCAGIGAVYSEVELEEFTGEAAEAHLQDLAWLAPRVCRHEAVIEQAMRRVPVLPARFATLFTSLQSLENYVAERREAIAGFFAALGVRQEWAVKGLLDRTVELECVLKGAPAGELARLGQLAEKQDGDRSAGEGTRYFQQRRLKAQVEREFNQRLKEFCRQAAATLGAVADGFRERKVLAAGEAEMVLNWAFLLAPAQTGEFRACLDRLNGGGAFPGLTLKLTGPWPPSSFAPDLSAGARE
jgi:hypothetical protein